MMTIDMIWAELALRGWVHSSGYLVKHVSQNHHEFITSGQARVVTYMADWPVPYETPTINISEDALRTMHDIIGRYERGEYEPRTDGSAPNIARVDSANAPERLGIQNDRPEYGGTSYRRSRFKRNRPAR